MEQNTVILNVSRYDYLRQIEDKYKKDEMYWENWYRNKEEENKGQVEDVINGALGKTHQIILLGNNPIPKFDSRKWWTIQPIPEKQPKPTNWWNTLLDKLKVK